MTHRVEPVPDGLPVWAILTGAALAGAVLAELVWQLGRAVLGGGA